MKEGLERKKEFRTTIGGAVVKRVYTPADSAGVEHTLTMESELFEIAGFKVCYTTLKADGYKIGSMSQCFSE